MTPSVSFRLAAHACGALCLALATACELEVESEPEAPPPAVPPSNDLYPALLVLDPALVEGPLGRNGNETAALSFRAQMEWLTNTASPSDFAREWIGEWETVEAVGSASAPVTPRPSARDVLLDRWREASVSSASDAGVGALHWSVVPFRLIAVVNRVDVARDACAVDGELRLVYTAFDPVTDELGNMTLSFNIPLPTWPAGAWAAAWQKLASLGGSAEYAQRLERMVREIHANADPLGVTVSTSETSLGPTWEMREFRLREEAGGLALRQVPLEFTPRADADPAQLSEHVIEHGAQLRRGAVPLPEALRAGSAEIASEDFTWSVPNVSEELRHAFSAQTCNGCHGGDVPTLPFRHIVPNVRAERAANISRYLHDPDAPSDELRRRMSVLEAFAAAGCVSRDGLPGD